MHVDLRNKQQLEKFTVIWSWLNIIKSCEVWRTFQKMYSHTNHDHGELFDIVVKYLYLRLRKANLSEYFK